MTKKNFFAEQAKFGYKTFYVEIKVGWLFSHKGNVLTRTEFIDERSITFLKNVQTRG